MLGIGFSFLIFVGACYGQCDYTGCFCLDTVLSCADFTEFPKTFATKKIESVILYNVQIDSIPSDLSAELPKLNSFSIYSGKVNRISAGAFANFQNVNEISFFNTDIGVIETGAFSNIKNISTLSFNGGNIQEFKENSISNIKFIGFLTIGYYNITVLRQNALNSISSIDKFQMRDNNIELMEKQSLNDLGSINSFSIHHNKFEMFKCMSMEPLLKVADATAFYNNEFSCTCDLRWLVHEQKTLDYLYLNWCGKDGSKVFLDNLNFTEFGCSSQSKICTENFEVVIATEPVQHSTTLPTSNGSVKQHSITNIETTSSSTLREIQTSQTSVDMSTKIQITKRMDFDATKFGISSTFVISAKTTEKSEISSASVISTKILSTETTTQSPQTTTLPSESTKLQVQNTKGNPSRNTNACDRIEISVSVLFILQLLVLYFSI